MRRAFALLCFTLAACGKGEMAVQHKFKPFRAADLFANGAASQTSPVDTVPYGAADNSMPGRPPMTRVLLTRGQERFDIYCAPCHGRDGAGTGLVQQRGFPTPAPITDAKLRTADEAYLFNVIGNGYGAMYPFASRIPVTDRWAIVAYLRALQLSQHADASMLSSKARAALEAAP